MSGVGGAAGVRWSGPLTDTVEELPCEGGSRNKRIGSTAHATHCLKNWWSLESLLRNRRPEIVLQQYRPRADTGVRVVDCRFQGQCGPHPRWVVARPSNSSSIGSDRRQQWVARRAFPRHAQPIEGVLNGVSLQNCSEEGPWTGTQILTTPLTAPRAASSSKQPRWRSVPSAR